ncbi:MAG: membrane protein insertase YidC [Ruminococcaceae bacterium]|nr:membrane protein insertase YidC [Oscillospiraceae bacterium]
MQGVFDLICKPFGWLTEWFYSLTGNYLIAILVFAVVLKLVLFPFGIKQQKNSQKQAALRPKENVIRKKYAGRTDRATQLKMNTEIQEMYQKENYSPFAGCLPLLLQMLVLIAVYAVVRMPLTYTSGISKSTTELVQTTAVEIAVEAKDYDVVNKLIGVNYKEPQKQKGQSDEEYEQAKEEALKDYKDAVKNKLNAEKDKFTRDSEIRSISYMQDHPEEFEKAYKKNYEEYKKTDGGKKDKKIVTPEKISESLPDLKVFKNFDLSKTPYDSIGEKGLASKLLLIVPVLSLVTSYLGQAITRKFTYQPPQAEEVKGQMRMMNVFMPLFSAYIATTFPAALGVYWIMSNVLSPVQQIVLSKVFPIKEITPEEMKEAERLYGGKQKKRKGNTATGKKKSLVYDDDDEYESVSSVNPKNVLKEKKESGGNEIIDKAPLKEDK